MVLRRWHSKIIERYVAEVLLDGADHAAWTAAHAYLPSQGEEIAAMLGRELTAEERVIADDIRDVGSAHRDACRQLCSTHGRITGLTYLRYVTRSYVDLGALADFIEYVICGTMPHADWVFRRRPMF